jgi:hypothetical protein
MNLKRSEKMMKIDVKRRAGDKGQKRCAKFAYHLNLYVNSLSAPSEFQAPLKITASSLFFYGPVFLGFKFLLTIYVMIELFIDQQIVCDLY